MPRILSALAFATLAAACGVVGGSVGPNDWTLVGVTPDDHHLLVTTLYGGVASDCTRWEGWKIDETDDHVEVQALLWRERFSSGCTDEGVAQTILIELGQPLGDRELIGCGTDDCQGNPFPPGIATPSLDAALAESGPAILNGGRLFAFTHDGELRWELDSFVSAITNGVNGLIVSDGGRTTTGLDWETGRQLWQADGYVADVTNDAAILCRGDDSELLVSVDAKSGADRWSVEAACETVVSNGEVVVSVAGERTIDGGYELLIVDESTGDLILRNSLSDGIDDQVTGFGNMALVTDRVVIAGSQSDLVVLGLDGQEFLRRSTRVGSPIGVATGAVIVADHDGAGAIDPTTGSTLWATPDHMLSSLMVSGDSLWALHGSTGTVSRLDPNTGATIWASSVGRTNGFAVAADQRTAYVATSVAVVALDAATGELQWWRQIPNNES